MHLINKKLNNYRGDTIVEVIIVLAILGLALSISYASANQSVVNIRKANENSTATEIAEQQVEDLYYLAKNTNVASNDIFTQTSNFCVQDPTPTNPTAAITVLPGTSCSFDYPYTIQIFSCDSYTSPTSTSIVDLCPSSTPSGNPPDTFIVNLTWPDESSKYITDSTTLSYRIHQAT